MRIAALLFIFCLSVFAFDINSFANQQKSTFLSNSMDVKTKVAPVVGYKDPNLNGGVDAYKDQNKTAAVLDLMNKTQGGNSWRYSCKDTRVIAEIEKWICSEDNFIYPKQVLCEPNCKKQGTCKQADCYGAFACENSICPINKTECTSSTSYQTPTCLAPAVWSSTSKKCESGGTTTYQATTTSDVKNEIRALAYSIVIWESSLDSLNGYYNGRVYDTDGYVGRVSVTDVGIQVREQSTNYVYNGFTGIMMRYNDYAWSSKNYSGFIDWVNYTETVWAGSGVNISHFTDFCADDGSSCVGHAVINSYPKGCNPGDTLSGTTCTHSTLVQTDGQCSTNYTLTNGQCSGLFYNCPLGANACSLAGDGKHYCSPYPCSTNSQNEQWCSADPIIGDGRAGFQCSKDGSWAITQDSCSTVCQFYKCQETSKTYTSNSECQTSCKQARPCTKY